MSEFAVMPFSDYIDACDKIREKTDTTENVKSGEMSDKINDVYDAGYDAGKQAEYDAFWDNYQNNGTRQNYAYAFYGLGWNDETFKPKYPIAFTLTNANFAFKGSRVQKSPYLLELDFSKCNSVLQTFMNSTVEELGILNFSNLVVGHSGINETFYGCSKFQ